MSNKPGAWETVKQSVYFLSDNWSHFLQILLPLFPYLYLGNFSSMVYEFAGDDIEVPDIFGLFAAITMALSTIVSLAFLASWHRAVILGVSDENKFNFFNMTEKDKSFIGGILRYFGFIFGAIIIAGALIFVASLIHQLAALILAVIAFCCIFYVGMRLYLYLPAKAVNADMTLKESYKSSKGLVVKILLALTLAGIPIMVVSAIVGGILGGILGLFIGLGTFYQTLLFSGIFAVMGVFIQIITTAIGAAILSRYYIWAVQERALS